MRAEDGARRRGAALGSLIEVAHRTVGGKSTSVPGWRTVTRVLEELGEGRGRAEQTRLPRTGANSLFRRGPWGQDGALSPGLHRWVAAGLRRPPCSPIESPPCPLPPQGYGTKAICTPEVPAYSPPAGGRALGGERQAAVGGPVPGPAPLGGAGPPCSQPALWCTCSDPRGAGDLCPYTGKGTGTMTWQLSPPAIGSLHTLPSQCLPPHFQLTVPFGVSPPGPGD